MGGWGGVEMPDDSFFHFQQKIVSTEKRQCMKELKPSPKDPEQDINGQLLNSSGVLV